MPDSAPQPSTSAVPPVPPVTPENPAPSAASTPSPQPSTPIASPVTPEAPKNPVGSAPPEVHVDTNEKLWGALSYIPMFGLLALLVKPKSEYIRLHGRQGLLLFGILMGTLIASFFLYVILPEGLVLLLWSLVQLGLFVIGVYSAYLAFTGHWWKIPVLGDIAEKIPVELFTKVATEALTGQALGNSTEEPVNQPESKTPSGGTSST